MSTQRSVTANGGDHGEFSFFEALSFDTKEPSLNIRELGQPPKGPLPSPPTKNNSKPAVPEKNALQRTATTNNTSKSTKPKPKTKMAPTKAQSQCLDLCHKTTASVDLISVHILECLTTSKSPPYGFEPLAHDFLDTCQILFSIEAGLRECNRSGQKLPQEMITELDHKFRVTQADFNILNQMLVKMIAPSNRIARGWGKLFGDNDIKKISIALGKTRESLRMSSLVFQWSLGSEKIEKEKGIGYTGLSAALDRLEDQAGNGTAKHTNTNAPQQKAQSPPEPRAESPTEYPAQTQTPSHVPQFPAPPPQLPSPFPFGAIDVQSNFSSHQEPPVPTPWSNRSSSIHHDGSMGRTSGHESRVPISPGVRAPSSLSPSSQHHAATPMLLPAFPLSSMHDSYERYDSHSTMDDARSVTNITEPDSFHEDFAALELDPTKIVRLNADPSSMPRLYPQNAIGGDTSNMKAALVSAIRGKNHKLVEQLLHRGVPPTTGPSMHALKEAVLTDDEEIVRLLLLFGADPNDPSRDGTTPLSACVERSFLAGATILMKYGADPNLAAGVDLESPLGMAVMANMVGFSSLLLTYNGDANHVTANGTPLLTSAIKKRTPKKFIDLLLAYGSDPDAKSREGKTALFEAISVGRADIVTSLLEHGANPNLPGPKHMLWPSNYQPQCLQILLSHGADPKKCPGIMELAVSINNIESVRILLKAGVSPNLKKDGTYTPLCSAIRDDRGDLVKLLLANGADPNLPAAEYPCFKCVTHKRLHFLPSLIAAGANLNSPKGILETAVSSNNMEALNWLLDQGVNPNDKTPKGMTPLTTAIRENRMEMVDLLLLRGADPHMRGENWPVCMAVRNPPILKRILTVVSEPQAFKGVMEMAVHAGQMESVKLLIAAGVSVEDKNGGVFSPLTTAIREDRREIVQYLLDEAGADINAPGEHLPVVKALRRYHGEGDTEILEMLLERGADPNQMYRGWNGVMQAVENGDEDVLKLLSRKAGVDLEVKDEMGRTVVEMAASRGWDEAVQILTAGDMGLKEVRG
ncbi:ankyrin repeat-containing domain protein [Tricladium varicosporioides]|nr:ankyrin repeat-containing domain protein [Hymenoscyphus varicosporioides]